MCRQQLLGLSTLSHIFNFTGKFHLSHKLISKIRSMTLIVFSFIFITFSSTSYAADTLVASVNKTQLMPTEQLTLSIVHNGSADSTDLDTTELSSQFKILGRRFGSSTKWVNGNYSKTTQWELTLSPHTIQAGELTIPSFEVNGSQSEPIQITLTEVPSIPAIDELSSMQMTLSTNTLYPKQSARLSMRLLISDNLDFNTTPALSEPTGNGLTIRPINERQESTEVINGVLTYIYEQDFSVTAENSGTYTLIAPSLTSQVVYRNVSQGTMKVIPLITTADPIEMNIKEIPDNYQGTWLPTTDLLFSQTWLDDQGNILATGDDSDNAKLSVNVGQPITRMIELEIKDTPQTSFPTLKINYPQGIRVYSDRPIYTEENGYTIMALKQVIIPNQTGDFTLPDARVAWWNSEETDETKAQQIASISSLELTVTPDPNAVVVDPASAQATTSAQDSTATQAATSEQGSTATQTSTSVQGSTATQTATSTQSSTSLPDSMDTSISDGATNSNGSNIADNALVTPKTNPLWFYVACTLGLFILILIFTVIWLIRRMKRLEISGQSAITGANGSGYNTNQAYQALIEALEQGNGVTIQQKYQTWQRVHPINDDVLKQEVQTEMNALMASFYGRETQVYDTSKLQDLLKQAQDQRPDHKQQDLAHL